MCYPLEYFRLALLNYSHFVFKLVEAVSRRRIDARDIENVQGAVGLCPCDCELLLESFPNDDGSLVYMLEVDVAANDSLIFIFPKMPLYQNSRNKIIICELKKILKAF